MGPLSSFKAPARSEFHIILFHFLADLANSFDSTHSTSDLTRRGPSSGHLKSTREIVAEMQLHLSVLYFGTQK